MKLMLIFSRLNTYYRLLLLVLSSSALFFLLYLGIYFYTIRQEKKVYRTASKEFNNEVNSIISLNSKTHTSTIYYVSFWDELVNFINTQDKKWYYDYIETEFASYESDYLGIYNLKNQLISHSSTKKITSSNFIPKSIFPKLYKEKLIRFYMQVPEGVIEVFGATIHPTDDPKKNKFKPSGYFFTARLLDKSFIQNLAEISSSTVSLQNQVNTSAINSNIINVNLSLKDWQGQTISNLHFERPFNLNFSNTKKILVIIIIATILNLLIYLYYYRTWVYRPIKLITTILETKNEQPIIALKELKGEFGHIGSLFEENNSQRKQLEIAKQKAEESDQLKSAFLANLSHEIRTPMNAIMGFSDLLKDNQLTESNKAAYLKIINKSGKNLISIIEDLIEMSKIDSKQITPHYKPLNLEKCLLEVYQSIKVTIPEHKKFNFCMLEASEKPKANILTDETKLKQILTNLITNAIKFTVEGYVNVGYELNENTKTITMWVEDTGLGIDEHHLKIVFDRFRRIENDFSVELSGLGLGLSITKAYVELLGGTIHIKSSIGIGSKFSFTIPLVYDESPLIVPITKTEENKVALGNKTLLIAEDDDINFLLLERILGLKNHKVIRACNGKEAVEICQHNSAIDLVFMDIKMPVMDGFEAFRQIRTFNQTIPIIANTAYSAIEDKERIMAAGFTNYLSKPLNKEKIFELLDGIHFSNS